MTRHSNRKYPGDPWALDINVKGAGSQPRPCNWPGCAAEGSYRAPKSRQNLRDNHWFCLKHVRIYNSAWNYYAGMTESEVEADIRRDTVWQRPSWPIGGGGKPRVFTFAEIRDPFDFFADASAEAERRPVLPMGGPTVKALAVLGLKPPVSIAVVKARYKELAKRYHPDANGGNTASEEKLRDVNLAYKTLMEHLAR